MGTLLSEIPTMLPEMHVCGARVGREEEEVRSSVEIV